MNTKKYSTEKGERGERRWPNHTWSLVRSLCHAHTEHPFIIEINVLLECRESDCDEECLSVP